MSPTARDMEEAKTIAAKFARFPDGRVAYGPGHWEDMSLAIAQALAARNPPPGHVRLSDGRVVKVLGTLPMTADECVAGRDAELWTFMGAKWKHYMVASEDPAPIEYDPGCDSEELYSTSEAALAAKEKP